jgi:hypothetical protein
MELLVVRDLAIMGVFVCMLVSDAARLRPDAAMNHVRTMRLVCPEFWADVRLIQMQGRCLASADYTRRTQPWPGVVPARRARCGSGAVRWVHRRAAADGPRRAGLALGGRLGRLTSAAPRTPVADGIVVADLPARHPQHGHIARSSAAAEAARGAVVSPIQVGRRPTHPPTPVAGVAWAQL